MARRRGFGSIRRLPSGRWQARYVGPDKRRHTAPVTFQTKGDAEAWLALRHSEIVRAVWRPPAQQSEAVTLDDYWQDWIATRQLKPRTRSHYTKLYADAIGPIFGHVPLIDITPAMVRAWYAQLTPDRPTLRAHTYSLLRTVLGSAVADELIPANPARIRGAGTTRRARKVRPASLDELETIVNATPDRLQLMVLLAAWCALRFGELTELRRRDIDVTNAVVKVRRGVVRADGEVIVGAPKTDASVRDVAIPPHLLPAVRDHLRDHTGRERDALLFPAAGGGHLSSSSFYRYWYPARESAGRPDLRFHDLRHTGAVLAAATGATLAELMARLGHSSPGAALRYQHAAQGRDAEIAAALSRMIDTSDGG